MRRSCEIMMVEPVDLGNSHSFSELKMLKNTYHVKSLLKKLDYLSYFQPLFAKWTFFRC